MRGERVKVKRGEQYVGREVRRCKLGEKKNCRL
jgi:hypothetical protein